MLVRPLARIHDPTNQQIPRTNNSPTGQLLCMTSILIIILYCYFCSLTAMMPVPDVLSCWLSPPLMHGADKVCSRTADDTRVRELEWETTLSRINLFGHEDSSALIRII